MAEKKRPKDKLATAETKDQLITFGLQSINESEEEMPKDKFKSKMKNDFLGVGRDDTTRHVEAMRVGRPHINSQTEETAEVGEQKDIRGLIDNDGEDMNQLDLLTNEERKVDTRRRGEA